ncbi:hypothetical protein [Halosimplex sp. TS25]|uniref:hypothetical protein n=1 Tax=Halosimplex rarum TaxID=3396619 RepID=UPI0039E8FC1E
MKQGSTDDPFAEEPQDGDAGDEPDEPAEPDAADGDAVADDRPDADGEDSAPATGSIDPASTTADSGSASAERERTDASDESGSSGSDATSERQTLPYIHARDGVKEGRTQRPVFLRDHVEAGIGDLVAEMEAELDADVYKTDVTEAAMAVAQENPELVLAKLEEWGYGWS